MEITLKPKHEKMIDGLVKKGQFRNRSAVVQAAMDVMAEREAQIEKLNQEIQKGLDQLDRGEGIPLETAFRQLKARTRERKKQLAARK